MSHPAIEIRQLRKWFSVVELERSLSLQFGKMFRRVKAVNDVSLTVEAGQVYGFLGPNGAGKTTTIKMCMDLIQPSRGTIRLLGQEPRNREMKAKIGYLPEHPYFYDYLKPQEILDYFGRLFGLSRADRKKRVDELIDRVGLDHARNRPLRKFSKGMLQRLGVAQALINNPEILFLDEPLSGLDPMGRKEIRDIIIEERSRGKTIFLSSHILSDIEHLCDRVAIIVGGTVRREGRLDELLESGKRQCEVLLSHIPEGVEQSFERFGLLTGVGANTARIIVDAGAAPAAMKAFLAAGAHIDGVNAHRDSLEDLFLRTAEANA